MKRIILCICLFTLVNWALGNPVGSAKAKNYAETFWLQSGCAVKSGVTPGSLTDISALTQFAHLCIFSNEGGFVILSGDDCAKPVLAYSTSGGFNPESIPDAVNDWLSTYDNRIANAVNEHLEATPEIAAQWQLLESGHWLAGRKDQTVEPLVTAQWGQGSPYNAYCPSNTIVGCIAVAMGQLMHYWKYPEHGIGSHSYTNNSTTHSVDFESATYNWDAMPNSCTSSNNDEVAMLLYHCGVAIETNYTSNNSTAYVLNTASHPINAESSMKQFFGYSADAHGERRVLYDKATWIAMLKSNLDEGIPIIYNGFNSSNSGGHCFICDGYDANDFFHFNWGLKGSFDGFFEIDDMTPSNQNFSYDQGAILGLVPVADTPPDGIDDPDNAATRLTVYPNPSSGLFAVECAKSGDGVCAFRVYDECGKLLVSDKMNNNRGSVDLSGRPDGIYFLHLIVDGKVVSYQKIVKVQ